MVAVRSEASKRQKADYQRLYRLANRAVVLERGRKCERRRKLKKYGHTEETYEAQLASQGYACGICGSYEPGGKHDWHVDHDHKTGLTRGILCHHCNLMLGNAKDNEWILAQGILYLRKYS